MSPSKKLIQCLEFRNLKKLISSQKKLWCRALKVYLVIQLSKEYAHALVLFFRGFLKKRMCEFSINSNFNIHLIFEKLALNWVTFDVYLLKPQPKQIKFIVAAFSLLQLIMS